MSTLFETKSHSIIKYSLIVTRRSFGSFSCHLTRVRAETANGSSKRLERETRVSRADPKISVTTTTMTTTITMTMIIAHAPFASVSENFSEESAVSFSRNIRNFRAEENRTSSSTDLESFWSHQLSGSPAPRLSVSVLMIFAHHHIISANVFSCVSQTRRRRRRRRMTTCNAHTYIHKHTHIYIESTRVQ